MGRYCWCFRNPKQKHRLDVFFSDPVKFMGNIEPISTGELSPDLLGIPKVHLDSKIRHPAARPPRSLRSYRRLRVAWMVFFVSTVSGSARGLTSTQQINGWKTMEAPWIYIYTYMYHPVGKPVKGMVQIIVSLFSNVFNQGQTNEEFMFRFLFAYLFMFRIFV